MLGFNETITDFETLIYFRVVNRIFSNDKFLNDRKKIFFLIFRNSISINE